MKEKFICPNCDRELVFSIVEKIRYDGDLEDEETPYISENEAVKKFVSGATYAPFD